MLFPDRFTSLKVDIASISAIIRLDHKYELKGLYDEALRYLTTYYTTNFDTWADGTNAIEWHPEPIHAIAAINLGRLTNTTSILPLAFYICATLGPEVARGFHRGDGSWETLSPDDLYLCLQMKERLVAENAHSAFVLLRPQGQQHCSNAHGYQMCAEVTRKILDQAGLSKGPRALSSDRALDSWIVTVDSYSPPPAPAPPTLGPYVSVMMYAQQARAVCKGCRSHMQTRDRELRRNIWRKLPEFIGLTVDNWDAPL